MGYTFSNIRHQIDLDVAEYREERAAIGEYERGMTREDAEREADDLAAVRRTELELRHLPDEHRQLSLAATSRSRWPPGRP